MRKRIAIGLILVQIIVITVVVRHLWQKKQVLGTVSINPIKQNDNVFIPVDGLKYFYEPKPNSILKNILSGVETTNTINADGLNERFDYSVEKPGSTYRIIALGDSFTFGSFIDTRDNWTEVLEDKLNLEIKCSNIKKFEVLNFGVRGYDIWYEVVHFRRKAPKYSPDLVLWYHVDPLRLNEELREFYLSSIKPINEDKNINPKTKLEKGQELFLAARDKVVEKYGEKTILNYQSKTMKDLRKYFSGPVVIIAQPLIPQDQKDFLKKQSSENGYFYYGDSTNYSELGGVFPVNLHPNKKGHEIISEDLFKYLNENKLIPCK